MLGKLRQYENLGSAKTTSLSFIERAGERTGTRDIERVSRLHSYLAQQEKSTHQSQQEHFADDSSLDRYNAKRRHWRKTRIGI